MAVIARFRSGSHCWRRGLQLCLPSTRTCTVISPGVKRLLSAGIRCNSVGETLPSQFVRPVKDTDMYHNGTPVWSIPGNHDWRCRRSITLSSTYRSILTRHSYIDQYGQPKRSTVGSELETNRLSITWGEVHRRFFTYNAREDGKIAMLDDNFTAAGNEAKESLAEEVEKDLFLQEVRTATQVANVETDVDADSKEDAAARLEKAERDYLEALGKGEMADLDLEKLEDILGKEPTGDSTVGTLYLKLGQEYDAGGESAEQILRCGEQALKIFQAKSETEDVKLELAMAMHLIGIADIKLENFEKSLPTLHKALELFQSKGGEQIRAAICNVQFLLGEALSGVGKPDEALGHLRAAVAEQELVLGHDHTNLGKSYRKLAEVLTSVIKHEEALPFIEKALKLHTRDFGERSLEVAVDRRLLAVIYIGLEDHEKALEQHHLVRNILSTRNVGRETVFVDISTADTEITLGKYDEAISTLQTAMSKSQPGSAMHALVLVNLAKVYESKKQPEMADRYAKEALQILENKVLTSNDPLAVAEGFTELAALYERIKQPESAIELLRKAHNILAPIPKQRHAAAGTQAQIGMLLFFTGKVAEAVPFLQSAVENLEDAVGDQNFALAMVLRHLGVANVELDQLEAAAGCFERAKGIFDQVLGADHDDTIDVVRNLGNTYTLLDRFDDAIKCQKELIRVAQKQVDNAEEMLQEAVEQLKMWQEYNETGQSISETLGSNPKFGRVVRD